MIINTQTSSINTNSQLSQSNFRIQSSSKAFEILSGLYNDQITAILRELGTNAADAHVEAGFPELPFVVRLPTDNEPVLLIKDFGLGMDHEQMANTYTVYFASSKTTRNDLNGCLGLGSKSPLAYTDSFSVVSTKNGTRRSYTVYMDDNGPELRLDDERKSDERSGTEIRIPVKSADVDDFKSKAFSVYQWFAVPPELYGFGPFPPPTFLAHGGFWGLIGSSTAHLHIVMAGVSYPVYSKTDFDKSIPIDVFNAGLVIYVPTGSVDIVPSREQLKMTKRTVAFLNEVFKNTVESVVEYITNKLLSCSNTLERIRAQNEMSDNSLMDRIMGPRRWNDSFSELFDRTLITRPLFRNFKNLPSPIKSAHTSSVSTDMTQYDTPTGNPDYFDNGAASSPGNVYQPVGVLVSHLHKTRRYSNVGDLTARVVVKETLSSLEFGKRDLYFYEDARCTGARLKKFLLKELDIYNEGPKSEKPECLDINLVLLRHTSGSNEDLINWATEFGLDIKPISSLPLNARVKYRREKNPHEGVKFMAKTKGLESNWQECEIPKTGNVIYVFKKGNFIYADETTSVCLGGYDILDTHNFKRLECTGLDMSNLFIASVNSSGLKILKKSRPDSLSAYALVIEHLKSKDLTPYAKLSAMSRISHKNKMFINALTAFTRKQLLDNTFLKSTVEYFDAVKSDELDCHKLSMACSFLNFSSYEAEVEIECLRIERFIAPLKERYHWFESTYRFENEQETECNKSAIRLVEYVNMVDFYHKRQV